jgi:hypothetical protein
VEADGLDDEWRGEDDSEDKAADDVSNAVQVVPEPAAVAAAAAVAALFRIARCTGVCVAATELKWTPASHGSVPLKPARCTT